MFSFWHCPNYPSLLTTQKSWVEEEEEVNKLGLCAKAASECDMALASGFKLWNSVILNSMPIWCTPNRIPVINSNLTPVSFQKSRGALLKNKRDAAPTSCLSVVMAACIPSPQSNTTFCSQLQVGLAKVGDFQHFKIKRPGWNFFVLVMNTAGSELSVYSNLLYRVIQKEWEK